MFGGNSALENFGAELENETPAEVVNTNTEVNTTPEVAPEVTPEEEPEEVSAEIDVAELDWLKGAEEEEPVSAPPAQEEAQPKQYEIDPSLLQDPEIAAIIEAKKAGKSAFDVLNELKGEDINAMSPEQLFENLLSQHNLTEEEKEYERERFGGMSKLEKLNLVAPVKQNLLAQRAQKLEQFAAQERRAQEVVKANVDDAVRKLDNLLGQKEYRNLAITPDRAAKIRQWVVENARADKNGKFDIDAAFNSAVGALYMKELVSANINIAKNSGKKEVFLDTTRPSKESTNSGIAPVNRNDESEEALNALLAKKAQGSSMFNYNH